MCESRSCHFVFGWVLLAAALLGTVIALVRCRVPLDYKIGGKLRIDLALLLLHISFSIVGLASYIPRTITTLKALIFDRDLEQPCREIGVAWMFAGAAWTFILLASVFFMSQRVWKSYYQRKRAAMKL